AKPAAQPEHQALAPPAHAQPARSREHAARLIADKLRDGREGRVERPSEMPPPGRAAARQAGWSDAPRQESAVLSDEGCARAATPKVKTEVRRRHANPRVCSKRVQPETRTDGRGGGWRLRRPVCSPRAGAASPARRTDR